MMERFKTMSPEEQQQFIARMKDRGQDTSAFEAALAKPAAPALRPKDGSAAPAQTIDALFAPLPTVETRGRAWVFMGKELKPVNLRLGISDGTNTELLSGEMQQGMEVVTGRVWARRARSQARAARATRSCPEADGSGRLWRAWRAAEAAANLET
jgi:hypothetical protein